MFKFKLVSILSASVFIAAFFIFPFFHANADIATGLVSHYKLDETSGTTASDSSGTNNGTLTNSPTWTTGKINNALNFDGINDYVSIPLLNYDEVSVSAWFNKNGTGTAVIFGGWKYNADTQLQEGYDLYFNSATPNKLQFPVVTKNTGGTRTSIAATYDFTDSSNAWHHAVGTYNKTTGEQKLYVDGQLVNTQTHPAGNTIVPLAERSYMLIGARYTTFGFFTGKIDDVRVYSRALSASDITEIYNYTGTTQSSSSSVQTSSSSSASSQTSTTDNVPPVISITSPTSASTYTTTSGTITISGTASDNVGVTSVTCAVNGSSCGTGSGTTSWSISSVPLSIGTNSIVITAMDSTNNQSTDTITITRTTTTTTTSNQWVQVAKRTAAQKSLGLPAGEGWQQISRIRYAPSDPTIVYMTVDTNQVWKSLDSGTTWARAAGGFYAMGATDVGIHPTNPNLVLATGMRDVTGITGPVDGMYRTTNGGVSWTKVTSANYTKDQRGDCFIFSGSTIYAIKDHAGGLIKSTDSGATWSDVPRSGGGVLLTGIGTPYDIQIKPNDPNIIFAVTSTGLYSLNISQQTQTKIGTGLPYGVTRVLFNPSDSSIVYATISKGGVYRSSDGGTSFNSRNNGLSTAISSGQLQNIAISPVNPKRLIVSFRYIFPPNSVYYTTDEGVNWTRTISLDEKGIGASANEWVSGGLNQGGWIPDFNGVSMLSPTPVFHPTIEKTALIAGYSENVKKTTDGGVYWKYSNSGYTGAGTAVFTKSHISFDPLNQNRAAYSHLDYGPLLTEDNEDTFRSIGPEPNHTGGGGSSAIAMRGNVIVKAVGGWNPYNFIVAVSRDNGYSHTLVSGTEGSGAAYSDPLVYNFADFHPQNSNIVYIGKWRFDNIQNSNAFTILSRPIKAIWAGNGDIVYSFIDNTTIYKSTDRGATWTTPYPAIPAGVIRSIDVDPTNQNRIYVGARDKGVYIINNTVANGGTIVLKNASHGFEPDGIGAIHAGPVAVDPISPNVVYAGMANQAFLQSNGVFRSVDYGETWTNISGNLGNAFNVLTLEVNPHSRYVYLGGFHGTWKLPPPGTVSTIDTTSPSVSITSPTSASTYTTTSSSIALSGTASDNTGIASVTCVNNGVSCGTVSGTTSWSVSNVPLSVGVNNIVITARDSSTNQNTTTKTLTVTRTSTSSSSSSSVSTGSSSSASQSSVSQSSSSSALSTLATTAKKTLSPVTIDGNLSESVWSVTEPVSRNIAGTNNNITTFNTLWDNNYLYVAVKVLDSVLKNDSTNSWQDDSIEIYIDGAHNHATTYDVNDRQIIKGQGDSTAVSFKVNTPNLIHSTTPIAGGYSMEFAIPWSDINTTPSANMTLGFDLQQNDDDTGGNIQNPKGWNSVTGTNYLNTSAFGHLTLSAVTVGTLPSSSSSSAQSSTAQSSAPRSSSSSSTQASSATQSSSSSAVSTTNKFTIGDRVVSIDNVNVRSSASLTGTLLGTQPIGSLGYILSNPTLSGGYSWYNVNFDNTLDGYAVDAYLEKTTVQSSSSSSSKRTGRPSGVRNLRVKKGSVILEWDAVSTDESVDKILIYRSSSSYPQSSDTSSLISTLTDISQTSYRDVNVSDNVTYYYSVFIVNDSGIFSDPANISFDHRADSVNTGGSGGGGSGGTTGTVTTFGSYTPSVTQTTSQSSSVPTPPQLTSRTTTPKKVSGPFSIGMRSNEVKVLQEILSSDSDIYPEGEVTGYYGPATTKAVKRFQKKHGIEETGLAGKQTRAKLNETYNETTQTQSFDQYQSQTVTTSSVFSRELRLKSKGDDVTLLQKRLTSEGVYSGPITGYYGPMTREAVRKYQAKNNLPPVGVVGPQTLQLLNGSSSNTTSTSSSQGISLTDLVEVLINLGVIAPDKATAAREALKTMGR